MRFFSSLHSRVLPWEDLLESLGLGEEKRTKVHRLSAAQQQKVSIALSFLHQPELLILDELTAAIEPEQRMEIWDAVNTMCEYGTSVFLATQDVSEAEHLCDQVGIMDADIDFSKPFARLTMLEAIAQYAPQHADKLHDAQALAGERRNL